MYGGGGCQAVPYLACFLHIVFKQKDSQHTDPPRVLPICQWLPLEAIQRPWSDRSRPGFKVVRIRSLTFHIATCIAVVTIDHQ